MSRVQTHGIILFILISLMAAFNYRVTAGDGNAEPVDMASWLPLEMEGWTGEEYDPPKQWSEDLPAARFLVRYYTNAGTVIEFLMIESADPGSFHSPMFCLPGAGWTPQEAGTTELQYGEVSKAAFVQDFAELVVRYWYLAGEKMTPTLWGHKWNMLTNKLADVPGPNFSFRVTVRHQGSRVPGEVADEFADLAIKMVQQKLAADSGQISQRE